LFIEILYDNIYINSTEVQSINIDFCTPPTSNWFLNATCHWVEKTYNFLYNLTVQDTGKLYLTNSSFNFTDLGQYIIIKKGGEVKLNETSQIM
jgi:hypothetical protein